MDFATTLRVGMAKKDMRSKDLAPLIEVGSAAISGWRRSKSYPKTGAVVAKIAEVLECPELVPAWEEVQASRRQGGSQAEGYKMRAFSCSDALWDAVKEASDTDPNQPNTLAGVTRAALASYLDYVPSDVSETEDDTFSVKNVQLDAAQLEHVMALANDASDEQLTEAGFTVAHTASLHANRPYEDASALDLASGVSWKMVELLRDYTGQQSLVE